MSWITSAKCFNGLVCIGDIQATITFNNSQKKQYINCVKKVHHIYHNLVVAFAGDIRVGLLMIEKLKIDLNESLEENTYFYLDGQTDIIINNLRNYYHTICSKDKPYVELLFCWYSQDEDENMWSMYNWKFKSPKFSRDSSGNLQVPTQIGSGENHKNYQDSLSFLSGNAESRVGKYKKIFTDNPEHIIWTITKYRNFLINQARQENFDGVSKSFYSLEAIIHYDKLYTEEDHKKRNAIYKLLDIELTPLDVEGDKIFHTEFNPNKIINIAKENPSLLQEAYETIIDINTRVNFEALFEPPVFIERFHKESTENISNKICSTWKEFESHMWNKYNISFEASSITATA